ncbi:hypothetical protein N9B82_01315 [Saprospiraceae bacterium]|nr:hypothetical protein [Saprospiraceae bacterium]
MDIPNKHVLIHIKNTQFLSKKIAEIVEIINSARLKKESDSFERFLQSFEDPMKYKTTSQFFILAKGSWEYEIEKSNWIWDDVDISDISATIRIKHAPLSNYSELLHVLVYMGIEVEDIRVQDSLFGDYELLDVAERRI